MSSDLSSKTPFATAMPGSDSPVTQQEIVSAINHHARELARLTATWPAAEPSESLCSKCDGKGWIPACDGPAGFEEPCEHCECPELHEERASQPPSASPEQAFEYGWRCAAAWMERDDLVADIGSPAYLADMRASLSETKEESR